MRQIPLLKKVGDNIFLKPHSHGQCSLSFPNKRLQHCSLLVEMVCGEAMDARKVWAARQRDTDYLLLPRQFSLCLMLCHHMQTWMLLICMLYVFPYLKRAVRLKMWLWNNSICGGMPCWGLQHCSWNFISCWNWRTICMIMTSSQLRNQYYYMYVCGTGATFIPFESCKESALKSTHI